MKKLVFLILLHNTCICISLKSQPAGLQWGYSNLKVVEIENKDPFEIEKNGDLTTFHYIKKIMGSEAAVSYKFYKNELAEVMYAFDTLNKNIEDILSRYKDATEALTEKYGKSNNDSKWTNNELAANLSNLGYAVSSGNYILSLNWGVDETFINHLLGKTDKLIAHVVVYKSKKYWKLLEDAEELNEKNRIKKNSTDF